MTKFSKRLSLIYNNTIMAEQWRLFISIISLYLYPKTSPQNLEIQSYVSSYLPQKKGITSAFKSGILIEDDGFVFLQCIKKTLSHNQKNQSLKQYTTHINPAGFWRMNENTS